MAHFLDRFLGDKNKKELKKLQKTVDEINALKETWSGLSDEELKAKTADFKARIEENGDVDAVLPEAFATVREAAKRTLDQFHYDVQLMGGIALHERKIAEMRTGEGKTLTSTLPTYLNALAGRGCHVATVNDYLSMRDAVWMGQVYEFLGLSVGVISNGGAYIYDPTVVANVEEEDEERDRTGSYKIAHDFLRPASRKEAYEADITYGTNNEFGFDYLRDNMVQRPEQRVQRELYFCLIDEVDSILIDEARTPLIISAPAQTSSDMYQRIAQVVRPLKEDEDYNIDEKMKVATLTDEGINKVEAALGIDNLYVNGGVQLVHHVEQALRAEVLYSKDKEYVVRDGEIVIVDEFTGRMMQGRRFSEGLHQAIEAKEGVEVKKESQTLGTVTFQNYFRMYEKLAGMTGTAATEEEEFQKIYDLSVVVIPTNRPIQRIDGRDKIYKNETAKINAIVTEVKARHQKGQPVLIGTVSIEQNERMSEALKKARVPFEMLNAKNHEREGEITANAGRKGAVTVATNMAGRGVDIRLGGAEASKEAYQEILDLGGLFVAGSERHESRRIDNQLRGRAGRQGDMGETQFYVSLDDSLMRVFGSDRMKKAMETLNVPDDMPIEHAIISKSLESAQKKVEGHNFDIRKRLLDFDNVLNKQREAVYVMRREVVDADTKEDPAALKSFVMDALTNEIENVVAFHTVDGADWNIKEIFETMKTIVEVPSEVKSTFEEFDGVRAPRGGEAAKVRNDLVETLESHVEKAYTELEELFENREELATIERQLLLRSNDVLWVEHLNAMRKLRSSVGLRGYAQRDPLVEYKRESFAMFQNMLAEVQKQVAYSVFKLRDSVQQLAKQKTLADKVGLGGTPTIKQIDADTDKKIGRNDPCHCGSGKKYKKCHGA